MTNLLQQKMMLLASLENELLYTRGNRLKSIGLISTHLTSLGAKLAQLKHLFEEAGLPTVRFRTQEAILTQKNQRLYLDKTILNVVSNVKAV